MLDGFLLFKEPAGVLVFFRKIRTVSLPVPLAHTVAIRNLILGLVFPKRFNFDSSFENQIQFQIQFLLICTRTDS